eukprot:scaffold17533_cov70-Attheya_sp.AAC.2
MVNTQVHPGRNPTELQTLAHALNSASRVPGRPPPGTQQLTCIFPRTRADRRQYQPPADPATNMDARGNNER